MRQAKTSAGHKEVLLLCVCESQMCMGQERLALKIRYSVAGQDTRLSPERPGFESRWWNLVVGCTAGCPVTAGLPASRSRQQWLQTSSCLASQDSQ